MVLTKRERLTVKLGEKIKTSNLIPRDSVYRNVVLSGNDGAKYRKPTLLVRARTYCHSNLSYFGKRVYAPVRALAHLTGKTHTRSFLPLFPSLPPSATADAFNSNYRRDSFRSKGSGFFVEYLLSIIITIMVKLFHLFLLSGVTTLVQGQVSLPFDGGRRTKVCNPEAPQGEQKECM